MASQPVFIKKVQLPDGQHTSAILTLKSKPILTDASGRKIEKAIYEMEEEFVSGIGGYKKEPLRSPVKIKLKPRLVVERKHSQNATEEELDIYPPSSKGFYGRLVKGTERAIYLVQELIDDDRLWLTVYSPETGQILSSHMIKPYEYDVIRLKTWNDFFYELTNSFIGDNADRIVRSIMSCLDDDIDTIEWEKLSHLTMNRIPPTFLCDYTSRNLLRQLAPVERFPVGIQNEILSFLDWVAKERIPKRKIIEFANRMYALPYFRFLTVNHFRFMIAEQKSPPYIDIIKNATEIDDEDSAILLEEKSRLKPEARLVAEIQGLVPDLQNEVMELMSFLNKSNEIVTLYNKDIHQQKPIQSPKKSVALYDLGIRLRAHVRPRSFGLREILYLGAAHRWPSWHLGYSIRLGPLDTKVPYIQGLVMPPSAVERIRRKLPKLYEIDWSAHTMNVSLYSLKNEKWRIQKKHLLESFNNRISLRKLKREFGYWKEKSVYNPSTEEVRVLDMANGALFYLDDLSHKAARNYWQTTPERSKAILSNLRDKGAIDIIYDYHWMKQLSRVFIELQGEQTRICSATQGLLKYVPTSVARIAENGHIAFILLRIPTGQTKEFSEIMENLSTNPDIELQYRFPTTIRNYQADLYRRLLNPDGTWNDDVSAFLSQIRS